MKKQIFTFVSIALFTFTLHAQVNVVPSGKVGVGGIASPSARLHVLEANSSTTKTYFTQDIGYAGFLLNANYSTNAYTAGFFWHTYDNNPTKPKAGIYLRTTSTGSYMYLGTSNAFATGITNDGIVISPEGNVGIGNASPSGRLHVEGSGAKTVTDYGQFVTNTSTSSTASINKYGLYVNSTGNWSGAGASNYGLYVNTQSASNSYAAIFNGGNVGIGTTAPARTLHVKGSVVFTSGTTISSFSPYIRGKNGVSSWSSPDYSWVNDSTTGIFHPAQNVIAFSTLNTERMRIDNNGNIGIGVVPGGSSKVFITSNDNCRAIFCDAYHTADWGQSFTTRVFRPLTVSYVVNYNSADRFYVRGDGLACSETGFYTWSDASYKENIVTIADPLQKVLNLRGVNYNLKEETLAVANDTSTYISSDPNPLQMGLIAQEVETIVPEVVLNMPNGKKAIAYQNLVGLLVEAIKQQNVTITQQGEEIELLRKRIDECCKTPSTGSLNGN